MRSLGKFSVLVSVFMFLDSAVAAEAAATHKVSLPSAIDSSRSANRNLLAEITPAEQAEVDMLQNISNACIQEADTEMHTPSIKWSNDTRPLNLKLGQLLANCVGSRWDNNKHAIHFEFFLDRDGNLNESIGK